MANTKKLIAILFTFLTLACLASCAKKEDPTTQPLPTTSSMLLTTAQGETEPTDEFKFDFNFNRLTGLDDLSDKAIGKRPIAIMVNNIKASLPQYGIYNADIMFEAEVEGGITRMMALFSDYTDVPKVCSVRSCRYYYPIFAHGFDAVYFSFGSNPTLADPTLKRIGIDYFDGTKITAPSIFGKDPERLKRYSTEHTAYVNGVNIPQFLKDKNVRTSYADGYDVGAFNFVDKVDSKKVTSTPCSSAKLAYSSYYYSTFEYNKDTGTYFKYHSGNKHIDQNNGKQLNYTNVFALETDVHLYTDNKIIEMDWTGGTGYYISKGTAVQIKWEKKTERSMIKVFDLSGNEIEVNKGNSYIGVIDFNSTTISK